jgi:hypothetical protein
VFNIIVQIDNRVRLVSSVLAASHWPDHEQAQQPHAVHAQAKMTRQYVSDFTDHPAVAMANQALASGLSLTDLFAAAVRSSWPLFDPQEKLPEALGDGRWLEALADFYTDTAIAAFFWAEHNAVWRETVRDLEAIFEQEQLTAFLDRLVGHPLEREIAIVPNLLYPALQSIGTAASDTLYLILPPPRAVGESPPWSYGEDAGWVLAESCLSLSRLLLADELVRLGEAEQALLLQAAVVLFLKDAAGEDEALAYQVRMKRQYSGLAEAVERLDSHLQSPSLDGLPRLG